MTKTQRRERRLLRKVFEAGWIAGCHRQADALHGLQTGSVNVGKAWRRFLKQQKGGAK